MEPTNYFRVLIGRWKVIVFVALLGLAAGAVAVPDTPAALPLQPSPVAQTFVATSILIADATSVQSTTGAAARSAATQSLELTALLATIGDVPRRAGEALGIPTDVVTSKVTATADNTVGTIRIVATDNDGPRAASLANTVSKELLAVVTEQRRKRYETDTAEFTAQAKDLQRQLDGVLASIARLPLTPDGRSQQQDPVLNAQRDSLLRRLEAANSEVQTLALRGQPSSGFVVLQEAVPVEFDAAAAAVAGRTQTTARGAVTTTTVIRVAGRTASTGRLDSRPVRIVVGLVAGIMAGIALALVRERMDTRVRTRAAAEWAFGSPILGEIPKRRRGGRAGASPIAVVSEPFGLEAEAFRLLRSAVQPEGFGAGGAAPAPNGGTAAIMVTSPDSDDGKTTVALNLAAAMAEAGRSVVVVDLDFRRSRLETYLDLGREPGCLEAGSAQFVPTAPAGMERVTVLSNGTPAANPPELLARAPEMLAKARGWGDVVLVDTPPLLAVSDAAELTPAVDGILLLCHIDKTTVAAATRSREMLDRLQAPVLGIVLVAAPLLASTRHFRSRRRPAEIVRPAAPAAPEEEEVVAAAPEVAEELDVVDPVVEEPAAPAPPPVEPMSNGHGPAGREPERPAEPAAEPSPPAKRRRATSLRKSAGKKAPADGAVKNGAAEVAEPMESEAAVAHANGAGDVSSVSDEHLVDVSDASGGPAQDH